MTPHMAKSVGRVFTSVEKTRQASPAVIKWLERAKKDTWTFSAEVRGLGSGFKHKSRIFNRTESLATANRKHTKSLLSLCTDVGQKGIRRNKNLRLSKCQSSKVGSENSVS